MHQTCLAMLDIAEQPLRWASMNTASIGIAGHGAIDATCRLFSGMADALQKRTLAPGTLPDLDALSPANLAEKLRSQLAIFQELTDPGLDSEEQHTRLATIQQLRAGTQNDFGREITTRAQALVREETERVRKGLHDAYAAAPLAVGPSIETTRTLLDKTRMGDPNWNPLLRFQEMKRTQDKIRQRRAHLPTSTWKAVGEALSGHGRTLCEQSLRALATELISTAFREAKAELGQALDDLTRRANDVTHALATVAACLQESRAELSTHHYRSEASVFKRLQGATEDQVIAGMLHQLHARDEAELARKVLPHFEARLRNVCPAWLDRSVPFPDLLRSIAPDAQAAELLALVEQTRGPGQTFYETLGREGVMENVAFLHSHSAPTVDLTGRDLPDMGLAPTRLCIVSMPPPFGANDGSIHAQVRAAFRKMDPDCTFEEARPGTSVLTATRLTIGFPIGIEGQGMNLLDHYCAASADGHPVHLFGIHPDAPTGEAIETYKLLHASLCALTGKETARGVAEN